MITMSYIYSRIRELRDLKAGWLDGDGECVSVVALSRAQEVLVELLLALPDMSLGIFPVPDGSVQAEAAYASWEIELVFTDVAVGFCATDAATSSTIDVTIEDVSPEVVVAQILDFLKVD